MHKLDLHIQDPHSDRKLHFAWEFPEKYEEFAIKHLRALHDFYESKLEPSLAYLALVANLIGIKRHQLNFVPADQLFDLQVDAGGKYTSLQELDYLKEIYTNRKSLMPWVGLLSGPGDYFKNLSIERFFYADAFATAYMADKKPEHLNMFFASAYRLPLLPWSKHMLGVTRMLAHLVSKRTREVALRNWCGLRNNLVLEHELCFEEPEESSGLERFGPTATIMNLAGPKFGTYNQAKKVSTPDAFAHFEMNAVMAKKMKEKNQQTNHGDR